MERLQGQVDGMGPGDESRAWPPCRARSGRCGNQHDLGNAASGAAGSWGPTLASGGEVWESGDATAGTAGAGQHGQARIHRPGRGGSFPIL